MKKIPFLRHFHWKMVLMRIVINAIVLTITVLVVPRIRFVDPTWASVLLLAIALGLLNALVKPILQFVFLPLIFASYGLVIVLVNSLLLLLLAWLFPDSFAVDKLFWALVAGALIGLLGTFLENLLGLIPPIVPDPETGLRRQFWDRPVGSLGGRMVTRRLSEDEQLVIEAPEHVAEADAPAPTVSPSEGGPPEADGSPDPPQAAPDAASSPPDKLPDTPTNEEGGL
mgnify:CR=1 FL=1